MRIALFVLALVASTASSQETYPWKAAAAVEKISPTENLWMAGYAARKGPMTGVKQDIFAKMLTL
ncbi:MAG: hypothetical protein HKN23_02120, partial [Verrucomicrobiales bacterium]|nr:hypothetical protein [Verrucomicrobiales bacterium]